MNRRNNRFLSDKLRYTKRATTKREFNFIPIPHGRQERGDAERTFALSPPKWASSPRDTPRTKIPQKIKNKNLAEISLIEPISKPKVPAANSESKQNEEQQERTINLAALRAAELKAQTQSAEKNPRLEEGSAHSSRPKLARDPIRKASDDNEPEKALQNVQNVQSEEKDQDPKVDDAETSKSKSSPSKCSTKAQDSSNIDSGESGRRSGGRGSVSTKDSKRPRSRTGSQSSKVEDSENEAPKTSEIGYDLKPQSRRSSRSSVVGDSENDVHKSLKVTSVEKSSLKSRRPGSRSSVVEDSENEFRKTSKIGSQIDSKEKSGGSEREDPSTRRKRSKTQDVATVSKEEVTSQKKSSRRSSESQKSSNSPNQPDIDRIPREKRARSKSNSSEKILTDEELSRRKSSEILKKYDELVAASMPPSKKLRRKYSDSGKSADEASGKRRASESGKSSGDELSDIQKKSHTEGGKIRKKRERTRSNSPEKITTGVSSTEKKATKKSVIQEKSTGGRKTGSSSSEKVYSKSRKSGQFKKTAREPTSKVTSDVNNASELSPGEGPSRINEISQRDNDPVLSPGEGTSKSKKVTSMSQHKSDRSKSLRKGVSKKFVARASSSSEEQWFSPQKSKVPNRQSGSKKGAKFKKVVKSKLIEIAPCSSDYDGSSDGRLFSPQKPKVPDPYIFPSDKGMLELSSNKSDKVYQRKVGKINKKPLKDVSADMSDEIPLQDKPLITTFAGLPLLDGEKLSSDEISDIEGKERLEEDMLNLEDILDINKSKIDRSFDISKSLKVTLLNPEETAKKRPVHSMTDLDIIWNALSKSLRVIIKETADGERRKLLHAMKSFLEKHFLSAIGEQLRKKEMHANLKNQSDRVTALTNKLMYMKQRNRQLAQKIYEMKEKEPPQNEVAVMDKFKDFCQIFAQFKRE